MGITRARRDCFGPSRRRRRWSCWRRARSRSCARGPRQPRSFPLYTSSPRRRSERRASKRGTRTLNRVLESEAGTEKAGQTAARIRAAGQHIGTAVPTVTIWLPERRPWRSAGQHDRAAVGGERTRYLIAMLWGLDPATEPSAINHVTVFRSDIANFTNKHHQTQITLTCRIYLIVLAIFNDWKRLCYAPVLD